MKSVIYQNFRAIVQLSFTVLSGGRTLNDLLSIYQLDQSRAISQEKLEKISYFLTVQAAIYKQNIQNILICEEEFKRLDLRCMSWEDMFLISNRNSLLCQTIESLQLQTNILELCRKNIVRRQASICDQKVEQLMRPPEPRPLKRKKLHNSIFLPPQKQPATDLKHSAPGPSIT